MRTNWFKLNMELAWMSWEAQSVVTLRLLKMARGGDAAREEGNLMVAEKLLAGAEVATSAMSGKPFRKIVGGIRSKVRRNRKRLLR